MTTTPLKERKRIVLLDSLRGFALLGIALANYPEFSLYNFLDSNVQAGMASAHVDNLTQGLLLLLVDGKFYTIFSVLFGIGFSIIIRNAQERGANGMRIFYRRMLCLAAIGFLHLMLVWSGDILLLYALMGMLLPWFYGKSNRAVLTWAGALLILPVICEMLIVATGYDPSQAAYDAWWYWNGRFGITEENFATWLRDTDSYKGISQFLFAASFERVWEIVSSHRYFKVLGLFLIGMYIGKRGIFADVSAHKALLKRVSKVALCFAFPLSLLYAWSGMNGHRWGDVVHSILYLVSVYPLGIGYMAILSLIFIRTSGVKIWPILAQPGRMSLTTYLSQSFAGILLFYGVGLGLGCSLGLWQTLLVAVSVFIFLAFISYLWLHFFAYGPFEWIWRMVTHGRYINPIRPKKTYQ